MYGLSLIPQVSAICLEEIRPSHCWLLDEETWYGWERGSEPNLQSGVKAKAS